MCKWDVQAGQSRYFGTVTHMAAYMDPMLYVSDGESCFRTSSFLCQVSIRIPYLEHLPHGTVFSGLTICPVSTRTIVLLWHLSLPVVCGMPRFPLCLSLLSWRAVFVTMLSLVTLLSFCHYADKLSLCWSLSLRWQRASALSRTLPQGVLQRAGRLRSIFKS